MKKIILTLLAAIAALSVDAQVIEVYRITQQTNPAKTIETLEAVYDQNYKVKFRAKREFTSDDGYEVNDDTKSGKCNRQTVQGETGDITQQSWVQLWDDGPKFALSVHKQTGSNLDISYNEYGDKAGQWGDNWRTPSLAELVTMISKCQIEFGSDDEYYFTIRGTNGKSISITAKYESSKYYIYLWTSFCATDGGGNTKRIALWIEHEGAINSGTNSIRIIPLNTGAAYILPILNE